MSRVEKSGKIVKQACSFIWYLGVIVLGLCWDRNPVLAQKLTSEGLLYTYIDQYLTDPGMWSRNAHYPAEVPEKNQYGIAPHSDHSFLTMLPTTEVPGLQILSQNGNWIDAKYIDKGILVNTGEFLNRWTNGRFIQTPHRVVPPEKDRNSIATFFNPSPETVAVPLSTCCSEANPPRYEPMSLIDYVCWYIDTNYQRDAGGKQAN